MNNDVTAAYSREMIYSDLICSSISTLVLKSNNQIEKSVSVYNNRDIERHNWTERKKEKKSTS